MRKTGWRGFDLVGVSGVFSVIGHTCLNISRLLVPSPVTTIIFAGSSDQSTEVLPPQNHFLDCSKI